GGEVGQMRSDAAATSIVSASTSRSRKNSQLGTLLRTSSQCAAGASPTGSPPHAAASRAHAAISTRTSAAGPSEITRRRQRSAGAAAEKGRAVSGASAARSTPGRQPAGRPPPGPQAPPGRRARRPRVAEGEARERAPLGPRMNAQHGLGDDPERALAPEKQIAEARADGRARHGGEPHDLHARDDRLEPE